MPREESEPHHSVGDGTSVFSARERFDPEEALCPRTEHVGANIGRHEQEVGRETSRECRLGAESLERGKHEKQQGSIGDFYKIVYDIDL